jgi:hypothetical protein
VKEREGLRIVLVLEKSLQRSSPEDQPRRSVSAWCCLQLPSFKGRRRGISHRAGSLDFMETANARQMVVPIADA